MRGGISVANNGIKECPFCGGKAELAEARTNYSSESYSVICTDCNVGIFSPKKNAKSFNGFSSAEDAIEAWNRRLG